MPQVLAGEQAVQPDCALTVDREIDRIHSLPGDGSANPIISVTGVANGSLGVDIRLGCSKVAGDSQKAAE